MLSRRCTSFFELLYKNNSTIISQNPKLRCIASPFSIIKYSTQKTDDHKNLSNKGKEIYSGSLQKQIKMVKVFSLSSSFAGVIGQPLIYSKAMEIGGTPVMAAFCGVVGFFTFVTPVLLHLLTRKYVFTITQNTDTQKYTATLVTFFLLRKHITFTPEDVHVPDLPGIFTTCIIGKTPVFIERNQFKDPEHYATIMGYNKPIDLDLFKNPEKNPDFVTMEKSDEKK